MIHFSAHLLQHLSKTTIQTTTFRFNRPKWFSSSRIHVCSTVCSTWYGLELNFLFLFQKIIWKSRLKSCACKKPLRLFHLIFCSGIVIWMDKVKWYAMRVSSGVNHTIRRKNKGVEQAFWINSTFGYGQNQCKAKPQLCEHFCLFFYIWWQWAANWKVLMDLLPCWPQNRWGEINMWQLIVIHVWCVRGMCTWDVYVFEGGERPRLHLLPLIYMDIENHLYKH